MADSLSLSSFLSGIFTQSVESLAYRMQLFVYRARINVCASLMSVIAMKPILRSFVPREVVDEGSCFFCGLQPFESSRRRYRWQANLG